MFTVQCNFGWCFFTRTNVKETTKMKKGDHIQECFETRKMYQSLLLRRWYEIMALYDVKSILTEISASRQDRMVLQTEISQCTAVLYNDWSLQNDLGHPENEWG